MAPIELKKGTNELMLKISQGGGGWSAHARIVGSDGQPIAGLRVEPQAGVADATPAPAPAPAAAAKPAELPKRDAFKKLRLSDQFYAEGAYYGDFNHDGQMDIVAGPFWFEGPDFQKRHEYRPAKAYDPKEYSDNFLTYVGDFNGDGWPDILCVPFPGAECYWYENPAGKEGNWNKHLAYNMVGNESPVWGDVNGDGRSELVFCNEGYLGYVGSDSREAGRCLGCFMRSPTRTAATNDSRMASASATSTATGGWTSSKPPVGGSSQPTRSRTSRGRFIPSTLLTRARR